MKLPLRRSLIPTQRLQIVEDPSSCEAQHVIVVVCMDSLVSGVDWRAGPSSVRKTKEDYARPARKLSTASSHL